MNTLLEQTNSKLEDALYKITSAESRVRKPFIDELKVKDALIE
jgi:hypothetical protein